MQAFRIFTAVILTFSSSVVRGQSSSEAIQKLESSGETMAARTALARAAEANPSDVAALTQYAEFLERYGDPGAREAYAKLLTVLKNSGDKQRAGVIGCVHPGLLREVTDGEPGEADLGGDRDRAVQDRSPRAE